MDVFNSTQAVLDGVLHLVDDDTGEILKTSQKPSIYDYEGIKFRVYKTQLFGKEMLGVVYTSKMLKEAYFTGINSHSFEWIYRNWMHTYFDCDYHSYLEHSTVVDCDFKMDFHMDDIAFSDYLYRYKDVSGSQAFYNITKSMLEPKRRIGVQLCKRNTATIGSPFVKFYSKHDEMMSRSQEFKTLFLPSIPHDLRRMEVTVLNLKHFESISCLKPFKDLKMNSLKNVLMFASMAEEICIELLGRHISRDTPRGLKVSSAIGVTPAKYLIFKMMHVLMTENNYSIKQCFSLLNDKPDLNDKSASRFRKDMIEVFKHLSEKNDLQNLRITPKDAFYPPFPKQGL